MVARGPDSDFSVVQVTDVAAFTQRDFFVPQALRPFISTFYEFRCDEDRLVGMHPSFASHLLIYLRGEGVFEFHGGARDPLPKIGLMSPCSYAARFVVQGGFLAVGAALTPLGWAALTKLDASKFGNRLFPASRYLGKAAEELAGEVHRAFSQGILSSKAAAYRVGDFIEARLGPLPEAHVKFMAQMREWLSENLISPSDLDGRWTYSSRQVQRLSKQYFGFPPHLLLRKMKALKAAVVLSDPNATEVQLARVYDYFYDQSHMIRELRLFIGRTPGALRELSDPASQGQRRSALASHHGR